MASNRSPNYPRISLGEAIERVQLLWSREGRSKLHPEGVAAILGYASYNGSAQGVISSLRKYGLLNGRGDELTISDDAITLLHAQRDSPERAEALRRAAAAPALFQEIQKDFPASLPSEENLRFRLIKSKGFSQDAATLAARKYRETWELVAEEAGGYSAPVTEPAGQAEGDSPMPSSISQTQAPQAAGSVTLIDAPPPSVGPQDGDAGGMLWLQVPFRGASLSVRIEAKGQRLTKQHVARVRNYLELAEEDLEAGGVCLPLTVTTREDED